MEKMKKRNEKHESRVTLKWAIPDLPCPPTTDAQKSNFTKEKTSKKMEKRKNEKKTEKFGTFEDFDAKSLTISRVCRCCCNFFDEILDNFHVFFPECVFSPKKINNQCWGDDVFFFFTEKVSTSIGRGTNTHFTDEAKRTKFAKVSLL